MKNLFYVLALLITIPVHADWSPEPTPTPNEGTVEIRPPFPDYPRWRHHRRVECVAVNLRGMHFFGRARDRREAAREAIESCYGRGSRRCELRYCRELRP